MCVVALERSTDCLGEGQCTERKGAACGKEMAVLYTDAVTWMPWELVSSGSVEYTYSQLDVRGRKPHLTQPSPSPDLPSVMLLNGDCSENLKKEEGAPEPPRENGLDEGEPGDEPPGQEVIVIQDTGFSVKILAPGIEPFSLQVRWRKMSWGPVGVCCWRGGCLKAKPCLGFGWTCGQEAESCFSPGSGLAQQMRPSSSHCLMTRGQQSSHWQGQSCSLQRP